MSHGYEELAYFLSPLKIFWYVIHDGGMLFQNSVLFNINHRHHEQCGLFIFYFEWQKWSFWWKTWGHDGKTFSYLWRRWGKSDFDHWSFLTSMFYQIRRDLMLIGMVPLLITPVLRRKNQFLSKMSKLYKSVTMFLQIMFLNIIVWIKWSSTMNRFQLLVITDHSGQYTGNIILCLSKGGSITSRYETTKYFSFLNFLSSLAWSHCDAIRSMYSSSNGKETQEIGNLMSEKIHNNKK